METHWYKNTTENTKESVDLISHNHVQIREKCMIGTGFDFLKPGVGTKYGKIVDSRFAVFDPGGGTKFGGSRIKKKTLSFILQFWESSGFVNP